MGMLRRMAWQRRSNWPRWKLASCRLVRNYENAIKKLGGTVLFSDTRILNARLEKSGAVTHLSVEAFNDGRAYTLLIVENKPMLDEVTTDAAAMNKGISETGRIAVYGIYFDTAKSVVKPESKPSLDELVEIL